MMLHYKYSTSVVIVSGVASIAMNTTLSSIATDTDRYTVKFKLTISVLATLGLTDHSRRNFRGGVNLSASIFVQHKLFKL